MFVFNRLAFGVFVFFFLCHVENTSAAVSWSSSPVSITFDYRFVDTPSFDVHVTSGYAMTCASSSSVSQVWSGGQASGFDCYDSAGVLQYSEFCRLDCLADETLTTGAVSALKTALSGVASPIQSSA